MDSHDSKIIKMFWEKSDKKKQVSNQIKVNNLQHWGLTNKSTEKSPTLKALVEDREIYEKKRLPGGRNYTVTFQKIMEELDVTFEKTDMELSNVFKRQNPQTKCIVIKTDTSPCWAFEGFGKDVAEATEAASRKGVRFFISLHPYGPLSCARTLPSQARSEPTHYQLWQHGDNIAAMVL